MIGRWRIPIFSFGYLFDLWHALVYSKFLGNMYIHAWGIYGWLRVHGPLLEIGMSSFAHQGRLRIPVSQRQVNKSSDMYQDPSRCCQGSRRTLLREMMWGNWIGRAGKSTHFKSLSLPTYLCSRAHSWAYGPSIWCYHTLELNASWVELHSLHRKTWWGTPLYTPKC